MNKVCNCGLPVSIGTSNKTGINKGRKFFGCPNYKDQESSCKFFEWGPIQGAMTDMQPISNDELNQRITFLNKRVSDLEQIIDAISSSSKRPSK